jgi:hypothetical protein
MFAEFSWPERERGRRTGALVEGPGGSRVAHNNSLERTRPGRGFRAIIALPGRSARSRYAEFGSLARDGKRFVVNNRVPALLPAASGLSKPPAGASIEVRASEARNQGIAARPLSW